MYLVLFCFAGELGKECSATSGKVPETYSMKTKKHARTSVREENYIIKEREREREGKKERKKDRKIER